MWQSSRVYGGLPRCCGHLPDTGPEESIAKPRSPKLETATARRKLAIRKKPYWITIAPGIALGYRRNAGAGTWSVRSTDGHGSDWIKRIGLADDQEPADGGAVVTFWQAQDRARELARGRTGQDGDRPTTVIEALERYEADLRSRGGDVYNARRARVHLTGALGSKPVALLGASELRKWRDGLAAKLAPASVNRTRTCLRAALELAAQHDPRIDNRRAWRVGLAGLPDSQRARNVILPDDVVKRIVDAAYARDRALGLLVEVAAVTGARLSQLARLEVCDLQADRPDPRLLMPLSAKGRMRAKRHERRPVPIPAPLARVLVQEAGDRPIDAPLLLRANGKAWGHSARARHRDDFRIVVSSAELNPDEVTLYSLRHSSIVRQLTANVPIRIVAALHDTSVGQVERNYSRHIAEHSDTLARRALLDLSEPTRGVIPLRGKAGRRSI
jgi:integrase